jgi:hypothetical protein
MRVRSRPLERVYRQSGKYVLCSAKLTRIYAGINWRCISFKKIDDLMHNLRMKKYENISNDFLNCVSINACCHILKCKKRILSLREASKIKFKSQQK